MTKYNHRVDKNKIEQSSPKLLEEGHYTNTAGLSQGWVVLCNKFLFSSPTIRLGTKYNDSADSARVAPQLLEEELNTNTAGLGQGWEGIT